jgi:signal transduction histidine kinase
MNTPGDATARTARPQVGRLRRLAPLTLALAAIWGAAGVAVVQTQRAAQQQALERAALFARVLADHTGRALGAVSLGMTAAAPRVEDLLLRHDGQPSGDMLQRTLADVAAAQPVLRSLSLVRDDGYVLASSQTTNNGTRLPEPVRAALAAAGRIHPLAASGRDLADARAGFDAGALHHLLLVARQMPATGGEHPLRLVAALNPEYFANQHALLLGEGGWRAALATLEGRLVAHSSTLELTPGMALPSRLAGGREHGAAELQGLDGSPALGAWRLTREHPFSVQVELPLEAAMAPWHAQRRAALGLAGAGTVIALVLAAVLARHRRTSERADAERLAAQAQLREHYETTEQLVDAMPVPVFLTDLHGNLLMANRAWKDWLTPAWGDDDDAAPARGSDDGPELAQVQPLLEHGIQEVCARGTLHWPLDLPGPGGRLRETVATKVALRGPDGRVRGVIGTLADVTEYKQAARATETARRAAEASNQARAEFVANVTHELRTPLQGILGFAELGEGRAEGQEKLQLMFRRVHQSGSRMLKLVDDLLDISRIGSTVGSIKLRLGPVDAPLREVADELRPMALARGLTLNLRIDPTLAQQPARADPWRLQQVARNVIANAMRFAPAGSAIDVVLRAEDGLAVTEVRDRGPGIPVAELESIFEPFVQSTRTKDGSGGTGLGLTICRQIMQAHGGYIAARNHPGGGAVFRWALPLGGLVQAETSEPATAESQDA